MAPPAYNDVPLRIIFIVCRSQITILGTSGPMQQTTALSRDVPVIENRKNFHPAILFPPFHHRLTSLLHLMTWTTFCLKQEQRWN